jgi:Secretion system C-terminal sorting domain
MRKLLILLFLGPLSITAQNEYVCGEFLAVEYINADCCCDRVKAQSLVFYPNPTEYELRVRNTEGMDLEGEWQIFDVQGRNVLHVKNAKSVDVSDLGQAVFVIRFDYINNKKADWVLSKFVKL